MARSLVKAENGRDRADTGPSLLLRPIRRKADIDLGLAALLQADPRLVPVSAIAGEVPLRLAKPDLAGLVSIIIAQQVSAASASAIEARLMRLVDPFDAATLLSCGETVYRQAGLSGPKQRTMVSICEAVLGGTLDLHAVSRMPPGAAIETMTLIKGIGPWTAEIYLLFCAGHADIFPAGDLALQEAVRIALRMRSRPAEKKLRQIAERWSPWRGVAARLLWAYYRNARNGAGKAAP